jgi:hypothetical protein
VSQFLSLATCVKLVILKVNKGKGECHVIKHSSLLYILWAPLLINPDSLLLQGDHGFSNFKKFRFTYGG